MAMSGLPVSTCAMSRTSPTVLPRQRVAMVACLTRLRVARLSTMDSATAVNTRLPFRLTAFRMERWRRDNVNRSRAGNSGLGLDWIKSASLVTNRLLRLWFPMQEHTRLRLESNLWQVNRYRQWTAVEGRAIEVDNVSGILTILHSFDFTCLLTLC
jgi:hypothetical protein